MTKGKDGSATKMFPDRIEKVIEQRSDVLLCCVIGIPDKKRINYPKAFIVPSDMTEAEKKFLRGRKALQRTSAGVHDSGGC